MAANTATRLVTLATLAGVASCGAPEAREWEGVEAGDCIDGEDNDSDGATDCDDSDCELHLDCNPDDSTWEQTTTQVGDSEPPTGTTEGLACDDDAYGSLEESGSLYIEGLNPGLQPLCSGELMLSVNSVVEWSTVEEEVLETYKLTDGLSRVRLDPEFGLLYGAGAGAGRLHVIDAEGGGAVTEIGNLGGRALDIVVASGGRAIVATDNFGEDYTYLTLVGGQGGTNQGTFDFGEKGSALGFSAASNQLFVGGGIDGSLTRYAYDGKATTLTEGQTVTGVCSGQARDVTVSVNGNQVVLVCDQGNDGFNTLYVLDPAELTTRVGEFELEGPPGAGEFSPDGERFAAWDGAQMVVFDAATYEQVEAHSPDLEACEGPSVDRLRWSQGNSILYGTFSCTGDIAAAAAWWVVD